LTRFGWQQDLDAQLWGLPAGKRATRG
jgi:hypothetical protein